MDAQSSDGLLVLGVDTSKANVGEYHFTFFPYDPATCQVRTDGEIAISNYLKPFATRKVHHVIAFPGGDYALTRLVVSQGNNSLIAGASVGGGMPVVHITPGSALYLGDFHVIQGYALSYEQGAIADADAALREYPHVAVQLTQSGLQTCRPGSPARDQSVTKRR